MTNTTPTPTPSSPLTPPPEVQALFDQADFDEHKYGVTAVPGAVQLVELAGGTVVDEVKWDHAIDYFRNILFNAVNSVSAEGAANE